MSSASSTIALAGPPRRVSGRAWPLLATAVLVALYAARVAFYDRIQTVPQWAAIATTRVAIETAALLLASRRSALPARLRAALTALGTISCVSTLVLAWAALSLLPGSPAFSLEAAHVWASLSFVLTIPAVLLIPMTPFRRGEWWTFLLDTLVSAGGFLVVVGVIRIVPLFAQRPTDWFMQAEWHGWVTGGAMLVVLNLLTLRRRGIPSPRAFWLFLAGLSAYLPMAIVGSLGGETRLASELYDFFYFASVVPTVWAAWAMLRDPVETPPAPDSPHWLRSFNPFALSMPAIAAAALLVVLRQGPASAVGPLALSTGLLSLLLVLRLVLTIRSHDEHLRASADARAHAQAERLEALRRAAGGVAHEFNNALTTVIGWADLGRAQSMSPESLRSFDEIEAVARRSAELTRDLLWFTGRQFQRREQFDANAWLRSLEHEVRAFAAGHIRVTFEPESGPCELAADADQLHDALIELVRNAVEAMPARGHLRLRSRTVGESSERAFGAHRGGEWHLTVEDTGHGIEPVDLPHIFEPFYGSRGLAEAPGLGLSVAQGVVLAHGGRIDVYSERGSGSSFTLVLPCPAPREAPTAPPAPAEARRS